MVRLLFLLIPIFGSLTLFAQADSAKRLATIRDTVALSEFTFSAKQALRQKGDTIVYALDSFGSSTNMVVEALLKKLPGIEVSADGNITAAGRQVSKIFVNGREYTGADLRNITRNLPASVFESAEIADWRPDDQDPSRGPSADDTKMLNLKFRKEFKTGVFGNAATGYGTGDRYLASGLLGYLGDKWQLNAIACSSNLFMSGSGPSNLSSVLSDYSNPGERERDFGTLIFSFDDKRKWKLSGAYEHTADRITLIQSVHRDQTIQTDSVLQFDQRSSRDEKRYQDKLSFKLKSGKLTTGQWTSALDLGQNSSTSRTAANDLSYYQEEFPDFIRKSLADASSRSSSVTLNNSYIRVYPKAGRSLALTASGRYHQSYMEQKTNLSQSYLAATADTSVKRTEDSNETFGAALRISYTEPLFRNTSVTARYNYEYEDGAFENTSSVAGQAEDSLLFVNQLDVSNRAHTGGISLQLRASALNIRLGLDLQRFNRHYQEKQADAEEGSQLSINYMPELYVRYEFSNKSRLTLAYNGRTHNPSLKQLRATPDYTDSLNSFIGNPELNPEMTHRMAFSFERLNIRTGRAVNADLTLSWISNQIIEKTVLDASHVIRTPVNVSGGYLAQFSLNRSLYLLRRKLRVSAGFNGSYANTVLLLNANTAKVENFNARPRFDIQLTGSDKFESSLSGSVNYTGSWSDASRTNSWNYTLTSRSDISLPAGIKCCLDANFLMFFILSGKTERSVFFLNASLEKRLFRSENASIRLYAIDLLNSAQNFTNTVGNGYWERREFNRMKQCFMIAFSYRFSRFPVASSSFKDQN
jgi:hypothetical protein